MAYNDAIRGMEGIISQVRKHNPYADIVMTFFANKNILTKLKNNQSTNSLKAHNIVANYYNVSVNNLAQELSDLIVSKKVTWDIYGGGFIPKNMAIQCVHQ